MKQKHEILTTNIINIHQLEISLFLNNQYTSTPNSKKHQQYTPTQVSHYTSQMNHTYQHKKGPPKMIKDLKHGNAAHLRQSLLDITEIQNLNKIFVGRKNHYKIQEVKNQSPTTNKKKQTTKFDNQQQSDTQEQLFTLSPQENLQLIKRQRITNKMKDKLQQMFRPNEARKYKLRKPILHNLLQEFKTSFRVEQQLKFKQALKDSEKILQHIKINNKKKISSSYVRSEVSCERKKFLSISKGIPVSKNGWLPTFEEFVNGKYKVKEKPFVGIDIAKIDNFFNTMITEPHNIQNRQKRQSFKDDFIKNFNRQSNSKNSIHKKSSKNNSPTSKIFTEDQVSQIQSVKCIENDKELIKLFIPKRNLRSKSAINPNTNFKKSQQSSKKIINAMQTYYTVKKQKIQQCDSMVEYIKKDRPLTSHLRRKNYKIIGSSHIDNLDKYRQKSQEERVKILEKNYNFYMSLLKIFQHCKKQQIPMSLKILNKLKEFFESQYILFDRDVQKLCELNKGDKGDFGVNIIYENLIQYAKKDENLSTQQYDQFEML